MTRSGLVLAAHGSTSEAGVNARIEALVADLARRGGFDEVRAAFHRGVPSFATVLDTMTADVVTVVPVMASDGYYAEHVLPRELAENGRFESVRCTITTSVGTHPNMAAIVEARVSRLLDTFRFDRHETTLALIGHGTERHRQSRGAVERVACRLRSGDVCGEVILGLLDEEPSVDTVPARATRECVIVLPFLIGAGAHAMKDVPRRLGIRSADGARPLFTATVANRTVVCDVPIGSNPGIVDIIVDLAGSAGGSGGGVRPTEGAA